MPEFLPPVVPEDLYRLRYLTDADIAPDGTRIAYAVKAVADDRSYRSALWVVAFEGDDAPASLTDGEANDTTPRWSPNGRWLAFLSDRGGREEHEHTEDKTRTPKQVHVLAIDGGETRALTSFTDGCSDIAWSPDSRTLLCVAKPPRSGDDAGDGIRVYDRLRYRSDEHGLSDGRRKHVWSLALDGSEQRRITDGDWDDGQPAFSHDGREIAFVSNRTADRDRNTVADIWTVPADGGEPRRITDARGAYGNPGWSPDGTLVGCYGTPDAIGSAAENVHLWVFPREGGAGRDLLDRWDRTVGSVVISDMRGPTQTLPPRWSGDRVVFVGSDQGTANAYSCASSGGDVRAETLGAHQLVTLSIAADGQRFAGVLATAQDPGNVVAGRLGVDVRLRTHVNADLLSDRHVSPLERIEFAGADGWPIEGWLLRPRGFDPARRWPLVLEIHGGPHTAYGHSFFHEFQVLAGRGYAVLLINPRGSHAYGEMFVKACVGDWGGKDHDDLMAGLDHVARDDWVDSDRLYVTGGSYGGFMTNWTITRGERFKAAVTQRSISNNVSSFGTSDIGWHFWEHEMGGVLPWDDASRYVDRSPLHHVTKIRTPLLILHAENDFRCPIEQAEQLFVALQVLRREAVFVRFPEDNHDLTRSGRPRNRVEHCRRIADWFDAHP